MFNNILALDYKQKNNKIIFIPSSVHYGADKYLQLLEIPQRFRMTIIIITEE